ncbi:MAG TPA: DUF169 domain-containing protein [Thermoanaerobaculia bacterium]
MENRRLAGELTSQLGLDIPPVALAFADSQPEGIPAAADAVPSACTFWREAESRVFYAPAAAHANCPIGMMTMGFEMSPEVHEQLMQLVGMACGCGYIAGDEPGKIPTVGKRHAGIVYGPLEDFPGAPDLILLWLTPRQAMLYSEAAGTLSWTATAPTSALGRPACSALPVALAQDRSTLSLGCMGMRTFTGIHEDRLLGVLPGKQAETVSAALPGTTAANAAMSKFYEGHKAQFAR